MKLHVLASTVLALSIVIGAAVSAPAQSAITQNNLLQNGGFDSGQAPWSVTAQGQYFYNDAGDRIASIGWVNGITMWQNTAVILDTNVNYVITVRARTGDGMMEGLQLSFQDATSGGTVLTNLEFAFPAGDAHLSPGPWRVFSLYVNPLSWPTRAGHAIGVGVVGRDTTAWGQYGWLHIDWVQLAPALPQFLSQPQHATNSLDASVTLTASALGAVMTNSPLDLRYQWFKTPATPVPNATNAALTLPSLTYADAGSYYVVVTNRYGSSQSSTATVVVLPPAAPLYSAYVDPSMAYVTNFEGWGTSLAWWANVAGGFTNRTLVIVAVNDTTNGFNVNYDLSGFSSLPAQMARHRTSPTETLAALPSLALAGQQLTTYLPAQSVTTYVLTNALPASPSPLPLAWYPLEGNAQDASTNGHHGTVSGNVLFVPGQLGAQSAQFDGSSGTIHIPRSVSDHFTIALWVMTTATGGTGQWWAGKGLVDGEVSGAAEDFGVALVGDKAALGVGNPDTTITSTTAINDGQWHHVAATRDAVTGQMDLYLDGSLEASALGPNGTKNAPPNLRLGSIRSGTPGGFLSGTIDDVQIFGRVLSADEIPRLMNHAPALTAISNVTLLAGRTLLVTNSASDPDLPAQTLRWSLLDPPDGASINTTNGLVTWRPAISQSPATSFLAVVVADDGIPSMSATPSFAVTLLRPAQPQMLLSGLSDGTLRLSVSGDAGPDYTIETATNLAPVTLWAPVFTNLSATPPFHWTNTLAGDDPQRFYRVRLSP